MDARRPHRGYTFPLLVALAAAHFNSDDDLWLAGACGIAAVLAIVGALILLPHTGNRAAMALLTAAGALPVLGVSLAVDRVIAALMIAALAAALLAIVLHRRSTARAFPVSCGRSGRRCLRCPR